MARPLRIQYPGAVYHVTCRGNERRDIFRDDEDRRTFLGLLTQSLNIYSVKLHAYVLMDNHFHLLVETPLGNLGEFMRHFNITYTARFNRRHKRCGNLYQGRYKSILVEKEAYLSALSRYIHLNPVKVKNLAKNSPKEQMEYLCQYAWSSLAGYLDQRKSEKIVDYHLVLADYGGDTKKGRACYRRQIQADLTTSIAIKKDIIVQSILGGEDFIRWVQETIPGEKERCEQPTAVELKRYARKDTILEVLERETGKDLEGLRKEKGDLRRMAMDLLYRYGGLKGPVVGSMFTVSYNMVSQERKRLRERLSQDQRLMDMLRRIESTLSTMKI